ncbi:MAG: FadR family transcriptional regulator [Desulfobacteraceae bacterium]|nr:FadR family transcriptional regulator [Desulfobacteraceae bacterium]
MFKKTAVPNRIFQDLVDQIKEAILNGQLKPGDKLPSQRDLGEQFQTSRATLREALRILEHEGLIEMKLGVSGGAVIKDLTTAHITESLNTLIQYQKVSFDHLAEFREVVEGNVAAFAAERANRDDLARLKAFIAEAGDCINAGASQWKEFARIDIGFHLTLAEISGNPVFKAVLQMVHENILESYEYVALNGKDILEVNHEHMCGIVEAVEQADAEKARELAQFHVRRFNEYMKKGHMADKTDGRLHKR